MRTARAITHPHVCRVYDVGEAALSADALAAGGHSRLFLTMEYIDGEDLAALLRRIGRLPVAKAMEVARQLCATGWPLRTAEASSTGT